MLKNMKNIISRKPKGSKNDLEFAQFVARMQEEFGNEATDEFLRRQEESKLKLSHNMVPRHKVDAELAALSQRANGTDGFPCVHVRNGLGTCMCGTPVLIPGHGVWSCPSCNKSFHTREIHTSE